MFSDLVSALRFAGLSSVLRLRLRFFGPLRLRLRSGLRRKEGFCPGFLFTAPFDSFALLSPSGQALKGRSSTKSDPLCLRLRSRFWRAASLARIPFWPMYRFLANGKWAP